MPTIGWFEILIVVAIAIVVLGPKGLSDNAQKSWFMDRLCKKICQ